MLDQMRCDHRPRRQSGTPSVRMEIAEGVVKPPPIDQPRRRASSRRRSMRSSIPVAHHVGFAVGGRRNRTGWCGSRLPGTSCLCYAMPQRYRGRSQLQVVASNPPARQRHGWERRLQAHVEQGVELATRIRRGRRGALNGGVVNPAGGAPCALDRNGRQGFTAPLVPLK